MDFGDDLLYSCEARLNEFLFFNDFNDVNIFVEDTGKEYEYETLFKRLLGEQYKVEKIIAVGSKEKVKKAFYDFQASGENDNCTNVFIVDGDFDRYINFDEMINHPNFIYLEAYNIESYFIDKTACEDYIKFDLKCFDKDVETKLDFENWRNKFVSQASELFFYYCFVKKNFSTLPTVSRDYGLFINTKTGFALEGAFEKYRNEVLALDKDADMKVEQIKDTYYKLYDNPYNIICGKFLFKSLCCYIKSITKKLDEKRFRWHLVCHCDLTPLNYLRDKILDVARN